MKKWIASAAALCLVVALAGPAVAAEHDSDAGFSWSLDIHQLVGWLTTLWSDDASAEDPAATSGEEPRAFVESVGPYIVPVGFTGTDPEAATQTDGDDEPGDS